MRRKLTVGALIVVGLIALSGTAAAQGGACDFPYETDDGTVIEEEPDRVVPGIASVSQTLWEIGAQEKVVGLTSNSFYLENSESYTDLGTTLSNQNFAENVTAQNPDLVINSLFEPQGLEETLESAGIKYQYIPQADGFEDIQNNTKTVGRLIGECEAANRVASEMEAKVSVIRDTVDGRSKPLVMYGTPTEGVDNYVPGNGTFKHDIITTAGAENVYDRVGISSQNGFEQIISDEKVVEALNEDPDWIVVESGSPGIPNTDLYNQTTAVQENQILRVNSNYINQDAPRITIPLERMARSFHTEAFSSDGSDRSVSLGPGADPSLPSGSYAASISVINGSSVAEFQDGPVDTVEINMEAEGEVSVTEVENGDAPGTPVQRVTIEVPEEARDEPGTVRMRVTDEALQEAGVPSEDLRIVREDSGWSALDTTVLNTEDGATLVGETTGFSDFAVVATTEPVAVAEANVSGEDVTLSAEGSYDEYGKVVGYEWTVGEESHEGGTVSVETDAEEAVLTVTNDAGLTNETSVKFDTGVEGSNESEQQQTTDGRDEEANETDATNESDPEDENGGQGMPGFTAVVVLVALVAAALVTRR